MSDDETLRRIAEILDAIRADTRKILDCPEFQRQCRELGDSVFRTADEMERYRQLKIAAAELGRRFRKLSSGDRPPPPCDPEAN